MNKDSESYKKRQRYWKIYYEIHREEKRAYDRAKYVPHPRPKIIRTPEEQKQLDEFKKERARKYYQEHKEYYKQKNHEHYLIQLKNYLILANHTPYIYNPIPTHYLVF